MMNPFNNKWLALLVVAAVLLVVAELVGTDEEGGILSQAAGAYGASGGEAPLPAGVVQVAAAETVDASELADEEVPEGDQPQVFVPGSPEVEDGEDVTLDENEGGDPGAIDQDVAEEPEFEDDGSDEG